MEPDDLQIAGFLFEHVQPAFESFVVDGSTTIISLIATPAVALLTIYVLFWGVAMASGQISEPFTDGMKRIIRMCIIIGFALTAGIYQGTVVDFFMQAPMEIAGQIVIPGSNPIGDDINSMSTMLDQTAAAGFDVAVRPWQEGETMHAASTFGVSGAGLLYQGVSILLCTIVVLTVAIAACLILVAYSALTVLLAIGPLFIMLALLPGTQRWFEAWLGQVVNFAIKVLLVILSAALMFKVLDTFFQGLAKMETAEMLMASLKAVGMAIFVLGVMFSMPAIASAIGGGVAASTAGLGGRLASMGTGAARMAVTGHSSRAITGAAAARNARRIGGAAAAGGRAVKAGMEMARKKFRPPNSVTSG